VSKCDKCALNNCKPCYECSACKGGDDHFRPIPGDAMRGCVSCPAYAKCGVTYRGSGCSALRASYGLDDDPEIITNADRIRKADDAELADEIVSVFEELFQDGTPSKEYIVHWLRQPVKMEQEDCK
jgi:hypothetical protein